MPPPFTFVAQTIARAAEVNANFDDIYSIALNKAGDTATGTINTQHLLPSVDATYDLGSGSFRYRNIFISGSITGPGAVNAFGIVAVSGQSNVVADTTADTVTLVAGTGISITTDAGTDSVTINATGAITGSITVGQGGAIYRSGTAAVGNVGAGEDNLYSQSIAANTLNADGQMITFEGHGSFAANGNDKRIRIKFGGTTILDMGPGQSQNGRAFSFSGSITRLSATTQMVGGEITVHQSTGSFAGSGGAAETLSGAVTFSITGEAVDNDDIVLRAVKLWWWPATNN